LKVLILFLFRLFSCFIFSFFLGVVSSNLFSNVLLNDKEVWFIEKHKVPFYQEVILNNIFENLSKEILDIFDDKKLCVLDDTIIKSFENAGFKIYNLKKNINLIINHLVLEHRDFPFYLIKIGFDKKNPRTNLVRIIKSDWINLLCNNKNLDITKVHQLEKRLYHRPKTSIALNDFNYVVISPFVEGCSYDQANFLSEKDIQQTNKNIAVLANLLQPLWSNHLEFSIDPANIFITPKGRIAFIDTKIVSDRYSEEVLEKIFNENVDSSC
jgi:hypothetical protein